MPITKRPVVPLQQALIDNLDTFVAFARKRVGDPHLAEDLVQESLLKAIKADRRPAGGDDSVRWFYRILRRSIIDLYRRNETRARTLDQLMESLPAEATPADERNLCRCFRKLLPDLPPNYRDLLERIDLGGEPVGGVAADLGLTVNNLNVRLHRARRQLRERLAQSCRVCSQHGCLDCTCDPPTGL
jgi:RNA polymerase sigma factor (sigma-70 family)